MTEVEKKGLGKAKVGLGILAVLVVIIAVTNVWYYTNLQNEINILKEENSQLRNRNLQQEQNITQILSRLQELERKKEWHFIDTFNAWGSGLKFGQWGSYPNDRILRVKWNATTLEYTDTPAFLVTSHYDGTTLLYSVIPTTSYERGVFYFQTIDGSFDIYLVNVESMVTCVLEKYR